MPRAYFTPYGVGLGHASRLILIADNLKILGFKSRFSSFGEAAQYIKKTGYECEIVPPVEFLWGKEGEFSVKTNISKIPRWINNLPIQVNKEIRFQKKFDPNVVISDSRLSPLIAGKILDVPSILVINQIKLLLTPRLRQFKAARFFEICNGEFMGGLWNLADTILIPDLPPPYTISEDNINKVKSVKNKIKYVGFIAPKKNIISRAHAEQSASFLLNNSSKPLIFVHISGPLETRKPIIKKILESATDLKSVQFVFSEGRPEGDPEVKKISDNIWYFEWCPIRDEIFELCDFLIIRGGHTAISQAIQYGKPILSIPIDNHGEQLANSKKIEKLGIGKNINPKNIVKETITQAIKDLIENKNYTIQAEKLKEYSQKLDGIQNIKNVILSYI